MCRTQRDKGIWPVGSPRTELQSVASDERNEGRLQFVIIIDAGQPGRTAGSGGVDTVERLYRMSV